MAQIGGDSQVVSQFPLPPRQYYSALNSSETALPAPPAPPGDDASYQMFGRVYTTSDKLPSLQESGRPVLYSEDASPTAELLRLNERLLSLFHILLTTLSTAGAPHQHVVARIEDVLINMQHLLNTLRPAQAARDLRTLLDAQAASRLKTAKALREAAAHAEDKIGEVAEMLAASGADGVKKDDGGAVDASVQAAVAAVDETLKREKDGVPGTAAVSKKAAWYNDREPGTNPPIESDGLGKDTTGLERDGATLPVEERKNRALFCSEILAEVDRLKNDPDL